MTKLKPELVKNIRENYDRLKSAFSGKNDNTVSYGDFGWGAPTGFSIIQLVTITGNITVTYAQFAEYEENKAYYESKLYGVLE